MKKRIAVFILVLCLLLCAGCGKDNLLTPGKTEPAKAGVLIRKDKEELVELRIEDGKATLSFNLDRWDSLYGIRKYGEENYPGAELMTGPSQVQHLSGKVKDACIGKVAGLEQGGELAIPAAVLLMEDGRLEWLLADPFDAEHYSQGVLPWLEGIVSLSYESDREGFGNMSIYAADADGARCDVRIPCGLIGIFEAQWQEEDCGLTLDFEEGGAVTLNGNLKGKYEIALTEGADQRPGMITFEFPGKRGVYFTESDGFLLTLFPADGDDVFSEIGETGDAYAFFQPASHMSFDGDEGPGVTLLPEDANDTELISWLLSNVEEARERVEVMRSPLEPRVPGDGTDIPGEGLCRDVWLGLDHSIEFEIIVYYTIAPSGAIYEYFPDSDEWALMYRPGAFG